MTDKIKCRLCDTEFDGSLTHCPKCGTDKDILVMRVAVPIPRGPVNDYASVLTPEQFSNLSQMLDQFFKRTDVPIVISIMQDTSPLTPTEYAFLMYNTWGIGIPGINQGLLLLLAMKEKHLETEVGLGLEKYLPETEGDRIVQDEFLPHFREGGFYEGLKAGTEAIIKVLEERLPAV